MLCLPSGLLATVPSNPNNGANGSNVPGVNTETRQGPGGSPEDLSIREGPPRTGMHLCMLIHTYILKYNADKILNFLFIQICTVMAKINSHETGVSWQRDQIFDILDL